MPSAQKTGRQYPMVGSVAPSDTKSESQAYTRASAVTSVSNNDGKQGKGKKRRGRKRKLLESKGQLKPANGNGEKKKQLPKQTIKLQREAESAINLETERQQSQFPAKWERREKQTQKWSKCKETNDCSTKAPRKKEEVATRLPREINKVICLQRYGICFEGTRNLEKKKEQKQGRRQQTNKGIKGKDWFHFITPI